MKNQTSLLLTLPALALLWIAGAWPAFSQTSPTYTWTTLAGQMGGVGTADGTGSAARFNCPTSVAVDSAGNVFVGDGGNGTIRKVTPAGVVTTLAGSAARFDWPYGLAVDSAGNVFVADGYNNTIRKVTSAGVVTTLAGSAGASGTNDGTGATARFNWPWGVAVDSAGDVFVGDSGNGTIRKVTPSGVVTTLAGSVGEPCGVAVDSACNVFVADIWYQTIRKVTPAGVVTTLAGSAGNSGSADGTGSAARFCNPCGVAVDSAGNVCVADRQNDTIRKVTSMGVVTTLAGSVPCSGSADGTGSAARFCWPDGVAVDSTGNVFVADTVNYTIRKVTPAGVVTTLAGSVRNFGTNDGTGSAALFNFPAGVAVDSTGNVFVADEGNSTIRKVTPAGVVTTLAGSAGNSGSADGTGSAARFYWPSGVTVDSAGNLFVADSGNDTIRKVSAAGVVTTLAGSAGNSGSADGTGSAARFNNPNGAAVDGTGNVFVADYSNSTIRKVTPTGVVTTIGGVAGITSGADGVGSSAIFDNPYGIAVDGAGNLYVADTYNNAIRKGRVASGGVGVTITVPPQSQVANAGATVSFSVTATGTGQLSYQWLFNGANIPGATSQTLTLDFVSSTEAGAYSVVVGNAYGSVVSAPAQLTVTQPMVLVQTSLTPTVDETTSAVACPTSPLQLKTFVDGAFTATGVPSPAKDTIILTHGWIPSVGPFGLTGGIQGWPADMAGALVTQGFGATNNIVGWDWSCAAMSFPCKPGLAAGQTPTQGAALGQALLAALGPGYGHHIHFIGHSFGTMVNAAAANYLHANGYSWMNTEMTLLDEAEIGTDVGCLDLFALALWSMPSASQTIYQPLPSNFDWADNYVSLVGQLHPQAANVILSYGLPTAEFSIAGLITDATSFHAYPCTWYSNTIPSPLSAEMGFRWSFEEGGLIAPPAPGTVYLQPATDDQYHQSVLVTTNWASATNLLTQRWQGYHISDRLTLGFTAVQLIDPAVGLVAGQMVSGEETSGVEAIINLVTQGGSGVSENVPHPLDGSPSTNTPACAWIPVTIPSNAVLMSFDFMLQGNGAQDSFAAALDGTNILSLASNLIQTNVDMNSGPIEVSQYAGQQVELFLGIVGGTSTNASLTISNFQFYAMPAPSLQAQASGTNLVISWPVSANGYALETSASLTGTNSWAPATNVPAIVGFQYTVTNAISGGSQFYRLYQQ